MSVRVRLVPGEREFRASREQSLLEGALDAGVNVTHSCKTGHCLACRARLRGGQIDYPAETPPLALTEDERAQGVILLCLARARSDVEVELLTPSPAGERRIRQLPCRIERMERRAHDVIALYLRLPPAAPLEFEAGQYLDIMLPGGRRRSFSIASPPHERHLLEIHVRRVPGGALSEQLFDEATEGRLLTIEAPLGHFVYRDSDRPMLLVGGGTGLAPLLAIMRHVQRSGHRRVMTLYWGVRGERDLYAHEVLMAYARATAALDYRPVLSDPSPGWSGRRGLVHAQVLAELGSLAPYEIYASGPPAMIAAVQREFEAHGAAPERLYFDSFDFAPDSSARQRTSAATSS